MSLDPHLAGVLKSLAAAGRKPTHECTIEEARGEYLALTYGSRTPQQVVPVGSVEDTEVPGGSGQLRARIYRPSDIGPSPTVVFFHGGGFVIGNLDSHDNMCRDICRSSNSVVVSVDYRLAPEHPFPAAVKDAIAATTWVIEHASKLGGSDVVAVAGDSAGGNLATVVAQHFSEQGVALAAQFLIYPALDTSDASHPSREENANGFFLEKETLAWFIAQYTGDLKDHKTPQLTPINAHSLEGLPPALIISAEFDPLRDEAEVYGQKLLAAGVSTEVVRGAGMIHGFFDMGRWSPAAQDLIQKSCTRFGEIMRGI
ncbi:alpha/beta hydrolase [Allohahella marinimesophila]|uniref:Alpha/beta hydrolase n=1 Tax=Allohahella marinimesophila TaxID=1054972 RepID=A0ABP7PVQ7_9GAMM